MSAGSLVPDRSVANLLSSSLTLAAGNSFLPFGSAEAGVVGASRRLSLLPLVGLRLFFLEGLCSEEVATSMWSSGSLWLVSSMSVSVDAAASVSTGTSSAHPTRGQTEYLGVSST
jgi:hypothetical protein